MCGWVCSSAAAEGASMGTSAVLPGAPATVKVEADLFSIEEGDQTLGPARPVRAFLAGPLEYKEHSEVLWEADRHREQ